MFLNVWDLNTIQDTQVTQNVKTIDSNQDFLLYIFFKKLLTITLNYIQTLKDNNSDFINGGSFM